MLCVCVCAFFLSFASVNFFLLLLIKFVSRVKIKQWLLFATHYPLLKTFRCIDKKKQTPNCICYMCLMEVIILLLISVVASGRITDTHRLHFTVMVVIGEIFVRNLPVGCVHWALHKIHILNN